MDMKRTFCGLCILLALFSVAGCGGTGVAENGIGIRGVITTLSGDGVEGNLLVEGKVEEDTSFDKASVRVTKETKIRRGTSKTRLKLSDVQLGDTVEVIMKGPVAESYPVQGLADVVTIINPTF